MGTKKPQAVSLGRWSEWAILRRIIGSTGALVPEPESLSRDSHSPAKSCEGLAMGSCGFNRQGLIPSSHGPTCEQIEPMEAEHLLAVQL